MEIILWTIGVIVYGLVCAAIGFFVRELLWSRFVGFTQKKEDVETSLLPLVSRNVESPDSELESLREVLERVVPEAQRTESLVLEDDVIHLPGEGVNDADLQIVEGIGPKIEETLKHHGITSRTKLAGASIDELRRILAGAGAAYQMHDPSTWSYQARLAIEGRWAELNEYQDFLIGGREL